ncbi:hypothetical protein D3C76_1693020 [compost metagenome]
MLVSELGHVPRPLGENAHRQRYCSDCHTKVFEMGKCDYLWESLSSFDKRLSGSLLAIFMAPHAISLEGAS